MNGLLTTLLADELAPTKALFVDLLDFAVEFEADWFVSLTGPAGARVGVMLRSSEFVPDAHRQSAQGCIITLVVDDVAPYHARAQALGVPIVEPPRDLPYGQRRLLLADASGALIDLSSPTAPLADEYR